MCACNKSRGAFISGDLGIWEVRMTKGRGDMNGYHLKRAFDGAEWLYDLSVRVDGVGRISEVVVDDNPDELHVIGGPVMPGFTNLHCHAFQFAMAGLTEARKNPVDTFWSWREMMYYFALRLSPDDQAAVAAKLYLECLKRGYTGVVEFHYIHNAPDGSPYERSEQMSLATLEAAATTGIQLTHLPVFYAHSDFGGQAPGAGQRRFVSSIDGFARMLDDLRRPCREQGVTLGLAPHSLRAVSEDEIAALVEIHAGLGESAPIHIHVAEQLPEVKASLAYNGKRPVEMLFDLAEVNAHWCLIHATHMTGAETEMVARSGAVVGLCPLTEANLGDGVFNGPAFLKAGGSFGVGSDSNVNTDPFAELQMLEYSQRLLHNQRTVMASDQNLNTGTSLAAMALTGGAKAAGRKSGRIATGYIADFFEMAEEGDCAYDRLPTTALLDYRMFTQNPRVVGDVVVGGRQVLSAGRHPQEDAINAAYQRAMTGLCQEI